jgi:restriction system protein
MAIPDFQTAMLPLLRFTADGVDHRTSDAVECLAGEFGVTAEERKELMPSGLDRVLDNRVRWANFYLRKAGLLESPRRGSLRITRQGEKLLASRRRG